MAEAPLNVTLSFGPMLIGVYLNMILYGILLNQMYFYFQTYKSDALWIRLLVAYLFVMETANTILDMAMMYQPLITEYGTEKAVANFPVLFMTEPIVIVLISAPIQWFFAWRINKITQSYFIPVIIIVLALASTAGGFITGVKIAILKLFSKKPELHWSALLWFIPSCVADLLITFTLVRSLSKRKTGFGATDSAIDKLIRSKNPMLCILRKNLDHLMIVTLYSDCADRAIFAIGDVAFFMALPHTALNFLWDLSLSKLYTNCLLSNLNARSRILSSSQNSQSGAFRNAMDPTSPRGDIIRHTGIRFADSSHNIMSTPDVYELESAKTFEAVGAQSQGSIYHGSEGFEITVTKVVERIEDPIDSSRPATGIAQ
ncbi:hypothetical protein F5876DRAFT_76587 [Lentinula aff. lateritia]|uniref:Uncharacterized protein n=1 Tax=Lentinula aff. lateritia TaxID=2804960 RepID=A0ACC1U0Q6_9AGAR|nr:hypothetical protein F5876DRAFT_76587 [Lentinula aff. lateritia]